jgi:hypothetical protein
MKVNPYRLVEYILIGLIVSVFITAFCVIITMSGGWHIVGWIASALVLVIAGFIGVEEWNSRKRLWDYKQLPQKADDTITFTEGKSK